MIKHQLEAVGFCPPFCQSLIGTKYGKSVAQVITRWLVERDIIVLAKSTKAEIAKLDGTLAAIVNHDTVDNLKRISVWKMGV